MKTQFESKQPATKRSTITPLANFQKLEADRQREWLFRRHRKSRPAWKRD